MKELTIQLQQEHKWGELNTFFKENSQYYKQIDNGEVFFIVGAEGTDFIANLFLNNLNETIVNDRIKSELIWNHIKYNRQGPEPWFDDHIIWDSPGHTDPKQHTTLLPENYKLLKTLDLPEKLLDSMDTNLKNFFSNDKTLNGTRYFITQFLPVIAYFYYKNFEKVKIIVIETNDVHIETYTRLLWILRLNHGKGKSAILSTSPERTTLEAWVEEHALYSILDKFKEIKKIAGNSEFTNGIIIEALIRDQWTFIDSIEKDITSLKQLNSIEPLYIDILHNLSSKNNAGIMDFPKFADQFYKINYRELFFQQNLSNIKTLMKLFNAEYSLDYYEKELYKYNTANIELKNRLEHELKLALDKLKNE